MSIFPDEIIIEQLKNLSIQDIEKNENINKQYKNIINNNDDLWTFLIERDLNINLNNDTSKEIYYKIKLYGDLREIINLNNDIDEYNEKYENVEKYEIYISMYEKLIKLLKKNNYKLLYDILNIKNNQDIFDILIKIIKNGKLEIYYTYDNYKLVIEYIKQNKNMYNKLIEEIDYESRGQIFDLLKNNILLKKDLELIKNKSIILYLLIKNYEDYDKLINELVENNKKLFYEIANNSDILYKKELYTEILNYDYDFIIEIFTNNELKYMSNFIINK